MLVDSDGGNLEADEFSASRLRNSSKDEEGTRGDNVMILNKQERDRNWLLSAFIPYARSTFVTVTSAFRTISST